MSGFNPPSSSGASIPQASSPPAPATATANSAGGHHEDRLHRTWRTLESSLVVAAQKAEKAAAEPKPSKPQLKELDEQVVSLLRTRVDWSRLLSYLEAKLEGTAKETEVLQHYHRSQPRLESRKRKREADAVQAAVDPEASVPPPDF